jgi:beta-lactamase regulating signal transducer with metallopeptidase domain
MGWAGVLTLVWCTGALGSLLWLIAGWFATGRVLRRSVAPSPELQTLLERVAAGGLLPRLVVTSAKVQPMAVGAIRPTIVLSQAFLRSETPESIEAAIAHEWAHIRRGDLRLLFLVRVLLPLLFAHPGYLWLRARIRTDLEMVADSWAARGRRLAYAELLLNWARSEKLNLARPAGALGLWGTSAGLRLRIENLISARVSIEPEPPRGWRGLCRVSAIAAVLAVVPFQTLGSPVDSRLASSPADASVACDCAPPPDVRSMLCPTDPASGLTASTPSSDR